MKDDVFEYYCILSVLWIFAAEYFTDNSQAYMIFCERLYLHSLLIRGNLYSRDRMKFVGVNFDGSVDVANILA